jgi:SAM-dependent methyltransferase
MSENDAAIVRFYDGLVDNYHLVYGDAWDAAVDERGAALDALIRSIVPDATAVLDCSCGMGTQALGLAARGYDVVGTDISPGQISRAQREAARLGVTAQFSVADFRDLSGVDGEFDVVLSCDNALPHLLDEGDLPQALAQTRSKLRAGGLLVVTMRDFDRALEDKPSIGAPAVIRGTPRRVLVRLHDWDDDRPCYTVRYLILTETDKGWSVREHQVRLRAITRAELTGAAEESGFTEIDWPSEWAIVGRQPVMTARAR